MNSRQLSNLTSGEQQEWDTVKNIWDATPSAKVLVDRHTATQSMSQEDAKQNRLKLKEKLHYFKNIYGGRGRDGRWGAFCHYIGIPRTTVDGYVRDWKRSLENGKISNGELSGSGHVDLNKLTKRVSKRLVNQLKTGDTVDKFLCVLRSHIELRFAERNADSASADVDGAEPKQKPLVN